MPSPRYQKGHKKLGGRKKGTLNKKTQRRLALEKLSSAELQQIIVAEPKLSPLEVMQTVMLLRMNRGDYDGALVAAEKAAPYMHAKLNATDVNVRHSYASKSDADVAAEIDSLRQKIAIAQQQSASAPPMLEATVEPADHAAGAMVAAAAAENSAERALIPGILKAVPMSSDTSHER